MHFGYNWLNSKINVFDATTDGNYNCEVTSKTFKPKLWTKVVNKDYKEKLWTTIVKFSCEQKLWA